MREWIKLGEVKFELQQKCMLECSTYVEIDDGLNLIYRWKYNINQFFHKPLE
jgi:hypothetical protein